MFRLRDLKPRPDGSSRLINDDFRGSADGYIADRHKGDTIDTQNKNRICPKWFTRMFN